MEENNKMLSQQLRELERAARRTQSWHLRWNILVHDFFPEYRTISPGT